jgi:predicted enzyme related to lactoylglutathione lyase
MPALTNGVGWFGIGTDQPEAAGRFYQELFGWQYTADLGEQVPFRFVKTPAGTISGGLFATGGQIPNYAVFCVVVDDVEATCRMAEEVGGKILMPPQNIGNGVTYAQLADPSGNQVGVVNQPAGG